MLIVEDGTVVAGANTYVTAAQFIDYSLARGYVIDPDDAELYIIQAMDYMESLSYIGRKSTKDQPLQWPRKDVRIDGYRYDTDELPIELLTAEMAVALAVSQGINPLASIDKDVSRVKVDVIEVEFSSTSASTTIVPAINVALRKLLGDYNNGFWFPVRKA